MTNANIPDSEGAPPKAKAKFKVSKLDAKSLAKLNKSRYIKDSLANWAIVIGGFSILVAVLMIFVYLLSESIPLFVGNKAEQSESYNSALVDSAAMQQASSQMLVLEEDGQVGLRITGRNFEVINTKTGEVTGIIETTIAEGVSVVSVRQGEVLVGNYGLGLSDGTLLIVKPEFSALGLGEDRVVNVDVKYPFGTTPIQINTDGSPLINFGVQSKDDGLRVISVSDGQLQDIHYGHGGGKSNGVLALPDFAGESLEGDSNALALPGVYDESDSVDGLALPDLYSEEVDLVIVDESAGLAEEPLEMDSDALALPEIYEESNNVVSVGTNSASIQKAPELTPSLPLSQKKAIVIDGLDLDSLEGIYFVQLGQYAFIVQKSGVVYVLNDVEGEWELIQTLKTSSPVVSSAMLQGNISLLLGHSDGNIDQLFISKETKADGDDRSVLAKVRSFKLDDNPITFIQPETRRKGFLAGDEDGNIGYFYTTSDRKVFTKKTDIGPIKALTFSYRENAMWAEGTSGSAFFNVHAEHPDVSFGSLWGKVWYESYDKPSYAWQSTSGSGDFEGKLSLMPLTFGTIKAAFWAMLFAAPLALAAAAYTAAFMAPKLRATVKPTIELLQALPTVILGFLAGLWLAPLVSENLSAVFALVVVLPIMILGIGFGWMYIPKSIRLKIPEGYAPVILFFPIAIAVALTFWLSSPIEAMLFSKTEGTLIGFLKANGFDYQSQNALIVGLMMGFAVIAPVYSIAEDAIFGVPKHLVNGSLALGATPWQTLMRVSLLTAAPGIFSALMIGFGRAVGETMIVLMATGNTAIMDLSLFNGMRTLSANVAVEMGEAEVGSTHFRVLFLSALVLLIMTFVLNTAAEIVRNRLRKKYGSL